MRPALSAAALAWTSSTDVRILGEVPASSLRRRIGDWPIHDPPPPVACEPACPFCWMLGEARLHADEPSRWEDDGGAP